MNPNEPLDKWTIDPVHSEIKFKVRHMMIANVSGTFGRYEADIEVPGNDLSRAKVDFRADVDSISTGNAQRDAHLNSQDFFSGEQHAQVRFVMTGASPAGKDGSWKLQGDLTMNGQTHPVELDAEWGGVMKDPDGNTKAGMSVQGKINRKQWGINWNAALEAGGVMVSDEVRIACEVEMVKQG